MVKFQELMGYKQSIGVYVNKEHYKEFLLKAKREGFLWKNGNIIDPDNDSYTNDCIVLTKDYFIYYPVGTISHMALNGKNRYRYDDLRNDVIIEKKDDKRPSTIKRDKDYETLEISQKIEYERLCELNRKLSYLQLQYSEIAKTLPDRFFVRFSNNEELLNLYSLLTSYGYSNKYNIKLEKLDPRVLCIDNANMSYYPASISGCFNACLLGCKFYELKDIDKIFKEHFVNH